MHARAARVGQIHSEVLVYFQALRPIAHVGFKLGAGAPAAARVIETGGIEVSEYGEPVPVATLHACGGPLKPLAVAAAEVDHHPHVE